jgi:hypothetical protein
MSNSQHNWGLSNRTNCFRYFVMQIELPKDVVEVWEIKEPEDTYEREKLMKKKNMKSVLDDDDNADKVIARMGGQQFFSDDVKENPKEEIEPPKSNPQKDENKPNSS